MTIKTRAQDGYAVDLNTRERDIVSYAYLCTYPVAAVDGDVLLWLSSGANNAGSITIFRV